MQLSAHDIARIRSVQKLIDADITRHHTIPDLAAYAGINISKLKAGFKYLYQSGIYSYRNKKCLEKGRYLLENTDRSLKEIISLTGYKHTSSFIKAFKKAYGLTPDAWRRRNRKHPFHS